MLHFKLLGKQDQAKSKTRRTIIKLWAKINETEIKIKHTKTLACFLHAICKLKDKIEGKLKHNYYFKMLDLPTLV
jgi:hypothetical protein